MDFKKGGYLKGKKAPMPFPKPKPQEGMKLRGTPNKKDRSNVAKTLMAKTGY